MVHGALYPLTTAICASQASWTSDMKRVLLVLVCAGVSGVAAFFGQPLVRENVDATLVMATVMTVFAGFLVAIIAVLGDPAMLPKGSWHAAEMHHDELEASVIRYTSLFYIYLLAIALLFGGVLLAKEPDGSVLAGIKTWVERLYVFFGVFSFLLTLGLPRALGKIQLARSEAEIAASRADAGIKDEKS
jgi:hypothetical protein